MKTADSLYELRNNYTIYNSEWNYCSDSQKLFEKAIPVYDMVNGNPELKYLNMFDYMNTFATTVFVI